MNSNFWNQMYAAPDYAYGVEPNDFLKTISFKPHSKILCLAEGQGRNAVYLAALGHDITMLDYSETGLQRAQELAQTKGVNIVTICADLAEYTLEESAWDAIVIVFGHFPISIRQTLYPQITKALKPDGIFVSETYSPEQVEFATGGPKDASMMASEEELQSYFSSSEGLTISIQNVIRNIQEGEYHNGESSVIQTVVRKAND